MARPLEGDAALQLLSFDDPDGKEVTPPTNRCALLITCAMLPDTPAGDQEPAREA